MNGGQGGENNLPLEWDEEMLAAANGIYSMITDIDGFAAANGIKSEGFITCVVEFLQVMGQIIIHL